MPEISTCTCMFFIVFRQERLHLNIHFRIQVYARQKLDIVFIHVGLFVQDGQFLFYQAPCFYPCFNKVAACIRKRDYAAPECSRLAN